MPDRVDPLGKRSLFWAPGPVLEDEDVVSPIGPRQARARARRAAGDERARGDGGGHPRAAGARRSAGGSAARTAALATPGAGRSRPARPRPTGAGRGADSAAVTAPPAPARGAGAALGKRALYSTPAEASGDAGGAEARPGSSGLGAVRLQCATCGTRSTVDLLHFLRLHLPFFVWRPGPGFARFMTCPACRRRSWISASWPAPSPPR